MIVYPGDYIYKQFVSRIDGRDRIIIYKICASSKPFSVSVKQFNGKVFEECNFVASNEVDDHWKKGTFRQALCTYLEVENKRKLPKPTIF